VTKLEHQMVIDRPIRDLFSFLVDPANNPRWQSPIVEARCLTEGPIGVGSKVVETAQFLGLRFELTYQVTEYQPPHRAAIEIGAPFTGRGSYTLEPTAAATLLTTELEIDAHGFFRLAESVFARMAKREFEASLGRLRHLLEVVRIDQRKSGPSPTRSVSGW
jgi:uncharacterized protein YndB with AHSA1/START domain